MNGLVNAASITAAVMLRLAPPPDITGSEWANEFRVLSPEASAEPGRFRIERTPYAREMLDAMTGAFVDVEEVWVKKSAQIAYSETLNNALAYYIHLDPGPMMMIQPTLEMAESYSKDRIEPMLRDVPALCELTDFREKKSANTILRKKFPGGLLQLIGANSPAAIASRPIRIVIGDEVDRWPSSTGKEGDPAELAKARQATFEANRLFVAGGTPVLKGASRTCKGYETTDQRVYMVECPHCHKHIELQWEHMVTDRESEYYATYRCQECETHIEHHHKARMIQDVPMGGTAYWQPTNPSAPDHLRGYFIWTAYSPFRSWKWICDKWHECQGDPEMEQVFYNTVLGLEYAFSTVDLDAGALFQQREDYTADAMPNDVLLVTAGIDTQDDRFEVEVVGWGLGEESWSLGYHTIDGDPALKTTRQALDDFLRSQRYCRQDGTELVIKAAFIDSGGHRTDSVYTFTRGKIARHIYACKGSNVAGQPIFARFSPLKKARVKLAIIGTDTAKELIYARLASPEESTGRMHFPLAYDRTYFEQLIAEEKVIRWVNGQPVVRFEKKNSGARNEPLDCRVYALAARRSLPIQLRVLARRDARRKAKPTPPKPPDTPDSEPAETVEKPAEKPQNPRKPAKKRAKRRQSRGSWVAVR